MSFGYYIRGNVMVPVLIDYGSSLPTIVFPGGHSIYLAGRVIEPDDGRAEWEWIEKDAEIRWERDIKRTLSKVIDS